MSFPSPKDFYERYRDDREGARRAAYELGGQMAQELLLKVGSGGNDLEKVAAVLNEFQKIVQGEPNARVEDGRITMSCRGLCPIMRAAMTLDIPWEWLDRNLALPMFHGMASSIVADMKVRLVSAKYRGDPACIYVFET